MGLLKRLSDSFWSYVSPTKDAPQTLPRFRKAARAPNRNAVQHEATRRRTVSSIDDLRARSNHFTSSGAPGSKRKRESTPSGGAKRHGRPRKSQKMDYEYEDAEEIEYAQEFEGDEDEDIVMQDGTDDEVENDEDDQNEDKGEEDADDQDEEEGEGEEDGESDDDVEVDDEEGDEIEEDEEEEDEEEDEVDEVSAGLSNIRVGYGYDDDDPEPEDLTVISEEEYEEKYYGKRKKIVSPTAEMFAHGISIDKLRDEGWDDDHITLVKHITMRGFEPLMPSYWKMDFAFMPDALFAKDDDAVISSAQGKHFHATKALDTLIELGGRMRNWLTNSHNGMTPEREAERMLKKYVKWLDRDCGLDLKTVIPQVIIQSHPADTPGNQLAESAKRNLAKLASRYREAFKVRQSIESSPGSTSTHMSYPIPTLYAIVASNTLIAVGAYNPNDDEPDLKKVCFLEMSDPNYDVWSVLALAIVFCHTRDVQIRIAEETGLGFKTEEVKREEERQKQWEAENDPDL